MKNCPKSKCFLSVIAVFIFIFAYDFVVHGVLLKDAYKATASLWRPEADMMQLWPLCFVFHGSLALIFTSLYAMAHRSAESCETKPKKKDTEKGCCPVKRGVCFGTILGLLLGVLNAGAYMSIAMPVSLAVSWFFAGLGQGVGVGVLLSLLNNKKSNEKK